MSTKSIRTAILEACAKHGMLTMDDLSRETGEKDQKRLAQNVGAAKQEKLIERDRDDVTGLPAYRITDAGRARLGAAKQTGDAIESIHCGAVVTGAEGAAPDEPTAQPSLLEKIDELTKENEKLRHDLVNVEAGARIFQELSAEKEAKLADLLKRLNNLEQSMLACGFVVSAPKRPLRRFASHDNAKAAAMAAARNGSGRGEVFAMIPVGKAVRGAEWRE